MPRHPLGDRAMTDAERQRKPPAARTRNQTTRNWPKRGRRSPGCARRPEAKRPNRSQTRPARSWRAS